MEERRAKVKDRQPFPCHGECGRMLRPWRRTVTQFPNTTMEYSELRCRGCWYVLMAERNPGDPVYAVMPCTGCGRPTRPTRCPAAIMPGTLRRVDNKSICEPCDRPSPGEESIIEARANLDRFMNRIRGTSRKLHNPYSPN